MKKSRLLNSELSAVIARMGHMDEITICDAGLPVPDPVSRIDLAVEHGLPSMLQVLDTVLSELKVEAVILASECQSVSPEFHQQLMNILAAQSYPIEVSYLSHEAFKQQTHESKAIVRTGEFTPYANIILKSGVVF
ncbi:D-ribose pyranase [Gynuella sunshinyii]|uniref:D-ribose pyranase n=1 Tax=Gynuella sunshinyii YC6258 TaxID=1445510 RepID=A0A0C5VXA3_9GAMM|nr:D-ribose pyranase [Gynuella sunshinyii]AJQ95064.1 ABC-type ribose transport system, auxiliary component [Gynuella sunshinyii YC6258]